MLGEVIVVKGQWLPPIPVATWPLFQSCLILELKSVHEVDICSVACLGNQWLSGFVIIAEEGSISPICPP